MRRQRRQYQRDEIIKAGQRALFMLAVGRTLKDVCAELGHDRTWVYRAMAHATIDPLLM